MKLPKPELYLVYTGDDRKNVPDEVSFKEDYFNGDAPVDLKIKILSKEGTSTIAGQYIGFCKVYNQQKARHNDSIKCAEETVKICIKKGYLVQYLTTHQKEVISMMRELFDEQAMRESYDKARARELKNERSVEIALNLLSTNSLSKKDIAKATGLTVEQVKELAKKIPTTA